MSKLIDKLHTSIFGSRCNIAPGIKYLSIDEFEGLTKDPFSFINEKGIKLHGYFYHYDTYDKNKLIVFFHGMGGGHEAYLNEINYLCKNGFRVLSYDYEGTILSEGTSLRGFLNPLMDADYLLTYLETLNLDLYLIGHSWGGFTSSNVINYHPNIKKLVMLSGVISLDVAIKDSVPSFVPFISKGLIKKESELFPKYAKSNAITALNNPNLKALVYHSEDDKMLSYKHNYLYLVNNCTNPNVKFISVNNKNHNVTYTLTAVKKLNEYLAKLKKLKTVEEKNKLRDSTNFKELCDLDTNVMDNIVNFFLE